MTHVEAMKQALEAFENAGQGKSDVANNLRQTIAEAEQEPKREPLTNQQIAAILERGDVAESNDKVGWLVLPYSFARAIEAAHGIKGEA